MLVEVVFVVVVVVVVDCVGVVVVVVVDCVHHLDPPRRSQNTRAGLCLNPSYDHQPVRLPGNPFESCPPFPTAG